MSNITLVFFAYTSVASLSACLLPSLKLVQLLLYEFITVSLSKPPEMARGRRIFVSVHSINSIVMRVCAHSPQL